MTRPRVSLSSAASSSTYKWQTVAVHFASRFTSNHRDRLRPGIRSIASLFAIRPKLNDYIGTRKELLEAADTLFAAVIGGTLRVMINHAYALKDAAKAYAELESRVMTGRRS